MSASSEHIRSLFPDSESRLPRIAPDAVQRPTLARWLSGHGTARIRALAAQPGAGKTTGVVGWLQSNRIAATWIDVPRACSVDDLRRAVAHARGETPHARLLVVDNVDRAAGDARAELNAIVRELSPATELIVIGRSVGGLDLGDLGVAIAPADVLRFDVEDVRRLCDVHDVPTSEAERRALLRATGGWALVVAGAVRTAALARMPLGDGLVRWRRDDDRIIAALIEEALATAHTDDAEMFRRILRGEDAPTAAAVARLADAGLFAHGSGVRARLNPLVMAFPSGPRAALDPRDALPVAEIDLFGSLRVRVAGQEIRFARRRDRNIVAFLALRADGKATRSELLDTFWPSGDRALARQSLRTACSMIRRAFATYVGEERVGAYFFADAAAVVLNPTHTANRLQLFYASVAEARAADERGEPELAATHWFAANGLYTAPLLAGEDPRPPWVAGPARVVDEMAAESAQRLSMQQRGAYAAPG